MVIQIPARTRNSVKRSSRISRRHTNKFQRKNIRLAQLIKELIEGGTKETFLAPTFQISHELRQKYLDFSQACFDKTDQHFVKIFLNKILHVCEALKKKEICLFNIFKIHKFQKLWRYVEKKLGLGNLKNPKQRLAQFHSLCIKYILPFEHYNVSSYLKRYQTMVLPNTLQLDPHFLSYNYICHNLLNACHVLIKFNPSFYLGSSSFPQVSGKLFLKKKELPLESFPAIHFNIKQRFPLLFSYQNKDDISQNKTTLSETIQQIHWPSIRYTSFDGSNPALLLNISDQSVEWFIIEDDHFEKVALMLNDTKLSLIENGSTIQDNFMDLVAKECTIINLLQRPRTHLFLNSGCFAWARATGTPALLLRMTFEIKSYRQLNAQALRRSLHGHAKKVPQTAHKLRIFLNQSNSQYSSYLMEAYKHLQIQFKKERILFMTLNINNIINKRITQLKDEESFCTKCEADILNYYCKDGIGKVMCLKCIQNLQESEFDIHMRMNEDVLSDVFDKYKKLSLIQQKKNNENKNHNFCQAGVKIKQQFNIFIADKFAEQEGQLKQPFLAFDHQPTIQVEKQNNFSNKPTKSLKQKQKLKSFIPVQARKSQPAKNIVFLDSEEEYQGNMNNNTMKNIQDSTNKNINLRNEENNENTNRQRYNSYSNKNDYNLKNDQLTNNNSYNNQKSVDNNGNQRELRNTYQRNNRTASFEQRSQSNILLVKPQHHTRSNDIDF